MISVPSLRSSSIGVIVSCVDSCYRIGWNLNQRIERRSVVHIARRGGRCINGQDHGYVSANACPSNVAVTVTVVSALFSFIVFGLTDNSTDVLGVSSSAISMSCH